MVEKEELKEKREPVYSSTAKMAFFHSEESALSAQFSHVSSGDLLVGLILEGSLSDFFGAHGLTRDKVESVLRKIVRIGAYREQVILGDNPTVKRIKANAKTESVKLHTYEVTPQGILDSLLKEEASYGVKILRMHGVKTLTKGSSQ